MTKYWILINSKNQIKQAVAGGFAQAGHGKSHPLRRMSVGDGIICYSPKIEYAGEALCQNFTAIGCVTGEDIYQVDLGNMMPHRRQVKYISSRDTAIAPLVSRLSFIADKHRWGTLFRYNIIRIPTEDFALIATSMRADIRGG